MFEKIYAALTEYSFRDNGGYLVIFDTRGERDCLVQYITDKYPPANTPYNWAIGLSSSYRHKGKSLFFIMR